MLIVEGEKAAESAKHKFPHYVVITTLGGSGRPGESDYTPLSGVIAIVWRDADEAGKKWEKNIVEQLRLVQVHCIKIVNLPENLPEGYDLADPWPEALRDYPPQYFIDHAVEVTRTPTPEAEEEVQSPYELASDGLYFNQGESRDRICARIQVAGMGRDSNSQGWSRILEFENMDGRLMILTLKASDLPNESTVIAALLDNGLDLVPGRKNRERILNYIAQQKPSKRFMLTKSIGWHFGNETHTFVHPEENVGHTNTRLIPPRANSPYQKNGSPETWQEQIGLLCAGNSRLTLAASTAFVGPLLRIIGCESGGIHLVGPSSSGKTTLANVASSVWGNPKLFTQQWLATGNGIEGLTRYFNDTLLMPVR